MFARPNFFITIFAFHDSIIPETEIVTAKPTTGNFLFGAKTAKLFKGGGGGDETKNATEALFEAIFGPGDKRDR